MTSGGKKGAELFLLAQLNQQSPPCPPPRSLFATPVAFANSTDGRYLPITSRIRQQRSVVENWSRNWAGGCGIRVFTK